jgi:hypothetical protein
MIPVYTAWNYSLLLAYLLLLSINTTSTPKSLSLSARSRFGSEIPTIATLICSLVSEIPNNLSSYWLLSLICPDSNRNFFNIINFSAYSAGTLEGLAADITKDLIL